MQTVAAVRMDFEEMPLGAWGLGVFENDTAFDFAADVAEGGGVSAIAQALDRVLSSEGEYLEARHAEEGLAAAEIVARLKGNPGPETAYTASIDTWIKGSQMLVPDELVDKARRSVMRILAEPSELVDLWAPSEEFDDWKRDVEAVLERL
jgi:hypothetical protein